jgi:hypothetical protein
VSKTKKVVTSRVEKSLESRTKRRTSQLELLQLLSVEFLLPHHFTSLFLSSKRNDSHDFTHCRDRAICTALIEFSELVYGAGFVRHQAILVNQLRSKSQTQIPSSQTHSLEIHDIKSSGLDFGSSSLAYDIFNIRQFTQGQLTMATSTSTSTPTSSSSTPTPKYNLRNPLPLSASQEQEVKKIFHKRVRAHCAEEIKGTLLSPLSSFHGLIVNPEQPSPNAPSIAQ